MGACRALARILCRRCHQRFLHGALQNALGPVKGTLGPVEGTLGPVKGALGPAKGALGPAKRALGPAKCELGPAAAAVVCRGRHKVREKEAERSCSCTP